MQLYGEQAASEKLEPRLKQAIAEVVREQVEAGIDIVNDGEFGKPMSNMSIMAHGRPISFSG